MLNNKRFVTCNEKNMFGNLKNLEDHRLAPWKCSARKKLTCDGKVSLMQTYTLAFSTLDISHIIPNPLVTHIHNLWHYNLTCDTRNSLVLEFHFYTRILFLTLESHSLSVISICTMHLCRFQPRMSPRNASIWKRFWYWMFSRFHRYISDFLTSKNDLLVAWVCVTSASRRHKRV